ncbi:hypothetical protein X474_10890 [Dethiosulfatarculus sandiegensis]|uniref:Uncharacterized protein n=1 Tax=Dethiosulfatarculus sandiegensis TaxID=1429043 RepID=A0A0D2JEI3_9BACT|nr:hypothetical protein X474_10890 [Dethiosulfatarculus sandiegensis]
MAKGLGQRVVVLKIRLKLFISPNVWGKVLELIRLI